MIVLSVPHGIDGAITRQALAVMPLLARQPHDDISERRRIVLDRDLQVDVRVFWDRDRVEFLLHDGPGQASRVLDWLTDHVEIPAGSIEGSGA